LRKVEERAGWREVWLVCDVSSVSEARIELRERVIATRSTLLVIAKIINIYDLWKQVGRLNCKLPIVLFYIFVNRLQSQTAVRLECVFEDKKGISTPFVVTIRSYLLLFRRMVEQISIN
jgi:hypothetical protein